MRCQKCGAELRENAKFCDKCGTKVEQPKIGAPEELNTDDNKNLNENIAAETYPKPNQPNQSQPKELFKCSHCGAYNFEGAQKCERCGISFGKKAF